MDLYEAGGFVTQLHDFNLGIDPFPGGLFWTAPTDPKNIKASFGNATASLHLQDLALTDYFNIVNALENGALQAPVAATLSSLDVEWSGPGTRVKVTDNSNSFEATLIRNTATMTWSATNAMGFSFVSDPAGTTSLVAQIGHEKNGVFFKKGDV
jgi:hypothetical protein